MITDPCGEEMVRIDDNYFLPYSTWPILNDKSQLVIQGAPTADSNLLTGQRRRERPP